VRDTTAFVGDGGPRFYLGLDPAEADPASALFVVSTTSPEDAVIMEIKARRYLGKNFLAACARLTRLSIGGNEDDWGNKTFKIVIYIVQDKAREHGITSQDISNIMDTFFNRSTYSTFRDGTGAILIVARAQGNFRNSLEDPAIPSVPASNGLISLHQVANF
jgi:multidrug efflux pump subunit AcrB